MTEAPSTITGANNVQLPINSKGPNSMSTPIVAPNTAPVNLLSPTDRDDSNEPTNRAIRRNQAYYAGKSLITEIKMVGIDPMTPEAQKKLHSAFTVMFSPRSHPEINKRLRRTIQEHFEWNATEMKRVEDYHREMFNEAVAPNGKDVLAEMLETHRYMREEKAVADLSNTDRTKILPLDRFQADTRSLSRGDSKKSVGEQWMDSTRRLTVQGGRYRPGYPPEFEEDDHMWVNTYVPPSIAPVALNDLDYVLLEPFFTHMAYQFPQPDRREFFFQWMSYCFLNPGRRMKFAVLLIAQKQGTGRGWLVELLSKLMGRHNTSRPEMKDLLGEWGDPIADVTMSFVEEVREGSKQRFNLMDGFKPKIDAEELNLNMKHGANKTVRVFAKFLMMTNHPDAVYVDRGERRLYVHENKQDPKPEKYYNRIYAALDDHQFIKHVAGFLTHMVDMTGFNAQGRAPVTEELERMVSLTTSTTQQAFQELAAEGLMHLVTEAEAIERMRIRRDEIRGDSGLVYDEEWKKEARRLIRRLYQVYGGEQIWMHSGGRMRLRTSIDEPQWRKSDPSRPEIIREERRKMGLKF